MDHFSNDCLPEYLAHEGGYVDHPKDPGGATNFGVTQATYDAWRRSRGLRTRSVKNIPDWEVRDIYRHEYWNRVRGDELPRGVGFATCDAAINSGVSRGSKWLQKNVKAEQDGNVGSNTVSLANAHPNKPLLIERICADRLSFMKSLKHWSTFKNGWQRRVAEVEARGVAMWLTYNKAPGVVQRELAIRSNEAGAKAANIGMGAVATPTAVTTINLSLENLSPVLIGVSVVVTLVVIVFLISRLRFHKSRSTAYLAELEKLK